MYALIAAVPILLTVVLMVGFGWGAKKSTACILVCCVSCSPAGLEAEHRSGPVFLY